MLVRENMKAYVSKSDDIETIQEKSRTIAVGEVREVKVSQVAKPTILQVLILVGEVLGVRGKTQTRFLRCFDQVFDKIFLTFSEFPGFQ